MLKISILETPTQRHLVVEGKLIAPWAAELRSVSTEATKDLNDRALLVDVRGLTAISDEGENVLFELMKNGARFQSSGLFVKEILKRLALRIRRNDQKEKT